MRSLRINAIVVACLVMLLAACGGALIWTAYRRQPLAPQTAGSLELPGLTAAVEVIRDRWGIPHIFAKNEPDLVRALGYVHAQDRLFQMDMSRRLVEGRLSEVVGERPIEHSAAMGGRTTVEQDIGMRTLGFEHTAAIAVEVLSDHERALLEAYADGVNAYIAQNQDRLPVEFRLMEYKPEPWRPVDTIALSRMLAWNLATNAPLELVRAAADIVLGEGGADRLLPPFKLPTSIILPDYEFGRRKPSIQFNRTPLEPLNKSQLSLATIYGLASMKTASSPEASNNWAVSGARSVSKKPILANDPHLPHLAPSIFHLVHLSGAGYDTIGAGMPGIPAVILGHNRHLAWASTNCQADVQDLYLHKIDAQDPDRYAYLDNWETFVKREETVRIKDGANFREEKFLVRVSRFGPVVTDLINPNATNDVLSLRWTGMDVTGHPDAYWEFERAATADERADVSRRYIGLGRGDDLGAMRAVNQGASCDDFFKAMSAFGSPRQNWICADDAGHIGYAAAGFVPVRNRGDGSRIARAWNDEGRWVAFIPFNEIPQQRDPRRGYIVTANNQTFREGKYPYPWSDSFSPGDRADRIVELIENTDKLDAAFVSRIQGDRQSGLARTAVPLFVAASKGEDALNDAKGILEKWNLFAGPNSAGAALFYTALDELIRDVLLDDLGPDLYQLLCATHQTWPQRWQIILDKNNRFHESSGVQNVREAWGVNYRRALTAAYARLQRQFGPDPTKWRWGDIHTITNWHPLGTVASLAGDVNIGPLPHGGGPDTVWAAFFSPGAGTFESGSGPVYRHVVDMAHPEKSWLALDTGEWGQPLSPHYADMNAEWRENHLLPGLMDRADIEQNVEGVLVLQPVTLP
jgi:penicillin amidase